MPRSTAIVASAIALGCIAYTHGDAQTPRSQSVSPRATASARDGIVPFKIRVPDDVLRNVRERLARTRFPDGIEESGWSSRPGTGKKNEPAGGAARPKLTNGNLNLRFNHQ